MGCFGRSRAFEQVAIGLGLFMCVGVALTGCGAGGASPTAGPSVSVGARSTAQAAKDPFANLPFRLTLPEGWIVLGSSTYDASLDETPDVAEWLTALDLAGPNAFRAYEPIPGGQGLRIAISPSTTWNSPTPGPLQDAGAIAKMPGVSGTPEGDVLAAGMDKAFGFRWTQTLDWGDGAPSARICRGYVVMGQYDPVNVVISFPADTDRTAETDALLATFEVTGNPVVSLPPGVTPSPSPTPFDKNASQEPVAMPHDVPELEALLPDQVGGTRLIKTSSAGTADLAGNPVLAKFGKKPADFSSASATGEVPPLLIIGVERLQGVAAADLLTALLATMEDAEVANETIGGRALTYVMYGAWPVWYFGDGELLYGVAAVDREQVAAAIAALP